MEDKLFLKRLSLFCHQRSLIDQGVNITTLKGAVSFYSEKVSELLRLGNILDKILILLDEMDMFLECFHTKNWKNGNNPNTDCYAVQLYGILRDTANKYQDDVDGLVEQLFEILDFYLKEAPATVRKECCLPLKFDQDSERFYTEINLPEIYRNINDSAISLSTCVKDDTILFGDYIKSI
ncbi:MAG: hypothetical protein PHI32_13300 [Dysgonamonadaceae bacterium]|nr:hypothetical protein [Dysgonamonadaceae bacterium]